MHLAIAADAYEEGGEEGVADLLREASKGTLSEPDEQGQYPNDGSFQTQHRIVTVKDTPDGEGGLGIHLFRGANREGKPSVGLVVGLSSPPVFTGVTGMNWIYGKERRGVRVMTPEEAKQATARLPNADHIHSLIDKHFPKGVQA